jgi:hypothetical protein
VVPEVEVIQHVDNVVRSVGVFLAQLVENAHLDQRLMMKSLLVADDFDCDILIGFVVHGSNDLPERALTDHLEYLVAIADVIMDDLRVSDGRIRGKKLECMKVRYSDSASALSLVL